MKKILLIEPNPYHTDGLPGIVQYLHDLHYTVDVYIQTSLRNDHAFCWYKKPLNLYYYDFYRIKELLNQDNIKEYDFIFFYSMEFTLNGDIFNIIKYLGFVPKAKYGILGIYHTTNLLDRFQDYQLMTERRFFCLSDFQIQNYHLSVLNPHYYGDIIANKSAEDSIICIGNAFDTNLLSDALYQIHQQKKSVTITHYGGKKQTFFKKIKGLAIFILSPFSRSILQKRLFRKYVRQKGRVRFETLFDALVKCKYILVLINPHAAEHEHYMTYTTSGVKQLILGFKKVPIIHEDVALKYGFDASNSILYNDKNLSSALVSSFSNDYAGKIYSINVLEKKIYKLSLDNLKTAVSKISSSDDNS